MPYIYKENIWCDKCGERIRAELTAQGKAPENPSQEWTYSSDDFPKWAGYEWGSDADSPQNCASGECGGTYEVIDPAEGGTRTIGYGTFLKNDLTTEGYTYLKEMLDARGKDLLPYQQEWAEYYHFTYYESEWASPHEWLNDKLERLADKTSMVFDSGAELWEYAKSMASELDAYQIQALFRSNMEEDGYFKKSGWYSPEMNSE